MLPFMLITDVVLMRQCLQLHPCNFMTLTAPAPH